MKHLIIALNLLLLPLLSSGSQIGLGLRTDKFECWDVFVNKNDVVKHKMLLYNKTRTSINIKIKIKNISEVDNHFVIKEGNEIVTEININPGKLYFIDYPQRSNKDDLLNFYENQEPIGMLEISKEKPSAEMIDCGYPYIYNFSGYWVGVSSITDVNIELRLQVPKDQYLNCFYARLFTSHEEGRPYWPYLEKYYISDSTIKRFTKTDNGVFHLKNTAKSKTYYLIVDTRNNYKNKYGNYEIVKGNSQLIKISFFSLL